MNYISIIKVKKLNPALNKKFKIKAKIQKICTIVKTVC